MQTISSCLEAEDLFTLEIPMCTFRSELNFIQISPLQLSKLHLYFLKKDTYVKKYLLKKTGQINLGFVKLSALSEKPISFCGWNQQCGWSNSSKIEIFAPSGTPYIIISHHT